MVNPLLGRHLCTVIRSCAGVNNDLAMRHIPEVAPKQDTLAGPSGRRSDQVCCTRAHGMIAALALYASMQAV